MPAKLPAISAATSTKFAASATPPASTVTAGTRSAAVLGLDLALQCGVGLALLPRRPILSPVRTATAAQHARTLVNGQ
jgi:hypothetical protein